MPDSQYRTKRKKIAVAMAEQLKKIDGNYPYNSNVFDNVDSHLKFLDEIFLSFFLDYTFS